MVVVVVMMVVMVMLVAVALCHPHAAPWSLRARKIIGPQQPGGIGDRREEIGVG